MAEENKAVEEKKKSKLAIGFKALYLTIYIGLGIFVTPLIFFASFMAQDNGITIATIQLYIFLLVLIVLYFWGLIKLGML